jgi:diguanylate cyclase (GGDEF)-like protein
VSSLISAGGQTPLPEVLRLRVVQLAALIAGGPAAVFLMGWLLPGAPGALHGPVIALAVILAMACGTAAWVRLGALQRESEANDKLYQVAEIRRGELESSYLATLRALAAALDAKDGHGEAHGRETAALCVAVGRRLGCGGEELRWLEYGALLHDIGKIGIPGPILNKPGPLTADEFAMMREHPVIGERILTAVPFLAPVLPMVRGEHERFDGGGYPDGLKGEEIPLGARIIFACDAFHAMARDRPDRGAIPRADALAELHTQAGTQFDPRVVEALIAVVSESAAEAPAAAAQTLPGTATPGGPAAWAQHLDSIQALGICLSRINSVPEIGQQIGATIVRLIQHDQCRIYLASERVLRPLYASTSSRPEYQHLMLSTFQFGEGLVGWVADTRQGMVFNDANRHPRKKRRNRYDESVVAVPIIFADEVLGVIALVRLGLNQYSPDHLRLLTILASQAAVSMANARMYERLTEEATTDPLTSLLNRRAMQKRIQVAVAEEPAGFALLLADIDGLKSINDRLGHLVGDQALLAAADCLRSELGKAAVGRWGGDEFLVLLAGLAPDAAAARGRAVQAALAARVLPSAPTLRLALSFGISHCPTHGTDVPSLLGAADQDLYRAKRGRGAHRPHAA